MFRKAIELAPADHRFWGNLADALLFDGQRRREAERGLRPRPGIGGGGTRRQPEAMAVNQAQTAYYASRLRRGDRARQCIENALADRGQATMKCTIYVGLAELGLGDRDARRTATCGARASSAIPTYS